MTFHTCAVVFCDASIDQPVCSHHDGIHETSRTASIKYSHLTTRVRGPTRYKKEIRDSTVAGHCGSDPGRLRMCQECTRCLSSAEWLGLGAVVAEVRLGRAARIRLAWFSSLMLRYFVSLHFHLPSIITKNVAFTCACLMTPLATYWPSSGRWPCSARRWHMANQAPLQAPRVAGTPRCWHAPTRCLGTR